MALRQRNSGDVKYIAGRNKILQLTPTITTGTYTAGDVFFATTEIKAIDPHAGPDSNGNGTLPAFPKPAGEILIQDILIISKLDASPQLRLYYFKSNVSIGALNAAEGLSDADAVELLAFTEHLAGWVDMANIRINKNQNVGIMLFGDTDSSSLYIAAEIENNPGSFTDGDIQILIKCFAD